MATMSLSLMVNLIANTQSGVAKVTKGLDTIRRRARDFRQGFSEGVAPAFTGAQFQQNIDKLDQRVNRARSRLTEAFAQGLALFAPVKMAADFDQAFRGVLKVLNDVPSDKVEQLKDFLLKTSARLPVSAANLSELMASAIQFGIPLEQVERFTEFTAKAAVAFDMQAGVIGRVMAQLANVYKLNQDEIEDLGDATNHLANNMAAEASQILDFANRAASAANVFKMSAVRMSGLGGAMIAAGIQPEIAARGMNAMANNILAGGKTVGKGFKQLGLNRRAFLKEMASDGEAAFMKLMNAAAKSPKGMQALINIVGKDFADDFGKLISNMDLFNKSMTLLNENRDGSVDVEYQALAEGAIEQWKQLLNKVTLVAIVVGDQLLPHMLTLADHIGRAALAFADFAKANPELTGWLVQATAAFLAFGIATRLLGFGWALVSRGLFGFLGLFFRFTKQGRNVAIMARLFRGLKWLFSSIKPLKWAALIPKLAWAAFITRLKWKSLAGKLSWRVLITPLKWGARLIPGIGWALLLSELAWSLVIKPLGWDKYLNLDTLKKRLSKIKKWLVDFFGSVEDLPVKQQEQIKQAQTRERRNAENRLLGTEVINRNYEKHLDTLRKLQKAGRIPKDAVPLIYDPAARGASRQDVQQKIEAAIIDKRPPNVQVNAPITIHQASNPDAVALAVRDALSNAVSGSKAGALHDGVD